MRKAFFLLLIPLSLFSCNKDEILRFEVLSGDLPYFDCPISVDLSALNIELPDVADSLLIHTMDLKEWSNGRLTNIPFQITKDEGTKLWFIMEGLTFADEARSYRLVLSDNKAKGSIIEYSLNEDELNYYRKDEDVLRYRISEKMPPEGVDPLYKRSAYIHPLVSPGGEVLTRIQPPDHYHHYGIWNPWTKTHINGREIDYWNLAKGEGTVRHNKIVSTIGGTVFGQFIADLDYIDFGSGIPERKTMDEEWNVKVWNFNTEENRYAVDLQSTFENVLKDTILFDAYRYGGGLGFRATEKWKADNCTVLTSEGNTRQTADGTKARWCMVSGVSDTKEGHSGILFLSHPDNREHPEPMRVWPDDVNQGEMFFEFCPIRNNDWLIEPGKKYTLKYRMIVFDGHMTHEEADMYWNGFAKTPIVDIR